MPARSRSASAAALRVAAAVCLVATWSLCACAPLGDTGASPAAATTEDDGLYRPSPPGEDGAYLPEDQQQGADDDGAYLPEKYERDESAREGAYDAKKYEALEGFDDGLYRPQPDEQENGAYHPESEEKAGEEDGSYRPEEYERSEGDRGLYDPQLYGATVGDDGAYHPEVAEEVGGDDGSYHPDTSSDDSEGDYNPEIYEKVVGDDGSYRGTEEEDGSYNSNDGDLRQEGDGMYRPEAADVGRETTVTRVRRQQSGGGLQNGKAHHDDHSSKWDLGMESGVVVKRAAEKWLVRGADGGVYALQTLEEGAWQGDNSEYHPVRFETPAPGAASDWDGRWTEGAAAATTEAADDGSYRPEHHAAEDYDERADNGQSSATPPVEPTEASDDGSYRPQDHTELPAEDYDERADNGTDWRSNAVEQHDEGTEAADDGSYRPQEHGPRERRAAAEDREEVQLSPVVFHVAPNFTYGNVTVTVTDDDDDDDARAAVPAATV